MQLVFEQYPKGIIKYVLTLGLTRLVQVWNKPPQYLETQIIIYH